MLEREVYLLWSHSKRVTERNQIQKGKKQNSSNCNLRCVDVLSNKFEIFVHFTLDASNGRSHFAPLGFGHCLAQLRRWLRGWWPISPVANRTLTNHQVHSFLYFFRFSLLFFTFSFFFVFFDFSPKSLKIHKKWNEAICVTDWSASSYRNFLSLSVGDLSLSVKSRMKW